MLNNKDTKVANELFDKSKSNLEAPMIGRIYTPICVSCANYVKDKNLFKYPTCKVYGGIPEIYSFGESIGCPEYNQVPNCPKSKLPNI